MGKHEKAMKSLKRATALYLGADLYGAVKELERTVQLARAAGEHALLVTVWIQKAGFLRDMGRGDDARGVLDQAEQLLVKLPSAVQPAMRTSLHMEQGIVASDMSDYDLAERLFREGEGEARKYMDNWGIVSLPDILANLATMYMNQGKLEQAQSALLEAAEIDRKWERKRERANDLKQLSLIYGLIGDQVTQQNYLQQALEVALEGGFLKEVADAMTNIAIILEEGGNIAKAQEVYEHGLDIYEGMGNKQAQANIRSSLANIAARKQDLSGTLQLHEKAYMES